VLSEKDFNMEIMLVFLH